ncbi:MAG TPA: Gfo/Idh/MocA family oxidoreductase [Pirellulaceae bacterium]|nr:Gfo/Idh/MocA family oxidoreductase [Pirellulaceae bacterium]
MSQFSRRRFLQTTAAASTAFSLFTIAGTKASGKVLGANEKLRVGVVGINGRGGAHIDGIAGHSNAQVTYLIDVDSTRFANRVKTVQAKGGNEPATAQDLRKALDDKNLDAITIATPNHWHSLMTIWACQAGKDVYVEKPISHNVFEGRKCVEAAKKYNRVVQHGTQSRSDTGKAKMIAAVQSGKYGKLVVAKGYCCKPRWSIGFKDPEPVPASLDFNLWLGPAPEQPFHRNLVHYNWHWFWDCGNGDIGNQGVHEIDVARWGIKDATLPTEIWSLGGRLGYQDQGQTPSTQMAVYKYGDVHLVFEVRGLVGKDPAWPQKVGNEFYTTDGVIKDGKFFAHGGKEGVKLEFDGEVKVAPGGAFGSFINACRTRKPEDNNAPAETAHYSAALCHLGNISYRLGKEVPFNQKNQTLGDNAQVVETFNTLQANLKAAGVKLDETNYTLGKVLKFDPVKEQFIGDDQANNLLTREYRAPFVVPKEV